MIEFRLKRLARRARQIGSYISPLAIVFAILTLSAGSLSWAGNFYDGQTGQVVGPDEILNHLGAGTVLIASELHDHEVHHQNQRDLLVKLSGAPFAISVGMEFFSYPDQAYVDDYVAGRTEEATFLKQIKWDGGMSLLMQPLVQLMNFAFEFYRFQVRFPALHNGQTLALNFPRELSSKVAKGGLAGLSDAEKTMMPPQFERGAQSYFERFREIMKDHAKEEQIQNYFTAQSLWDDTMAWRASSYLSSHPEALLMIIVGDFHVAYQDGLIARLKSRGVKKVVSLSQIDTTQLSESERKTEIEPSPKYGPRADFVFDAR